MLGWLRPFFFLLFFFACAAENEAAFLALGVPWKEVELFRKKKDPEAKDWQRHFEAVGSLCDVRLWQESRSLLLRNSTLYKPSESGSTDVEEEVAWALLACRSSSSQPKLRALAYLSASLSDDARALKMLLQGLGDSHRKVREVSAKQLARFPDEVAKRALRAAFRREADLEVRNNILRTLSAHDAPDSAEFFLEILNTGSEAEQEIALEALLGFEYIFSDDTRKSFSPTMRGLFCCFAEDEKALHDALSDRHPSLRALSLERLAESQNALSQTALSTVQTKKFDPDPRVRVLAEKVLFLSGMKVEGKALLDKLQHSESYEERLYAAAALSTCGYPGKPFLDRAFEVSSDPFILATLSQEIPDHQIPKKALEAIHHLFFNKKQHVVRVKKGSLTFFAPWTFSKEAFDPTVEDLLALEALEKISSLDSKLVEDALFAFLERHPQGLSAPAAGILLQEGNPIAREKLKEIYQKAPLKQKLEIAFVLILFGEREEFLPVFYASYRRADFTTKALIIEALLQMEERSSASFLYQILDEKKARLSTIAAGAFLRNLYR